MCVPRVPLGIFLVPLWRATNLHSSFVPHYQPHVFSFSLRFLPPPDLLPLGSNQQIKPSQARLYARLKAGATAANDTLSCCSAKDPAQTDQHGSCPPCYSLLPPFATICGSCSQSRLGLLPNRRGNLRYPQLRLPVTLARLSLHPFILSPM